MKTNRNASLAETKGTADSIGFFRLNRLWGALAALILMLCALQSKPFVPAAIAKSSADKKNGGTQPWSVQIEKVDPGDVSLDPSFGVAIYENLLEEVAKTKQFREVFRCGDRNANDVPGLLILKVTVQKYTPGSETRRAVTTVSGATKLNVRIQLSTRDGRQVLEQSVEGDVRFIGNNLRATHNLARNVAVALKRSTLPEPTVLASAQKPGETTKYQAGTIPTCSLTRPSRTPILPSSVSTFP